jgi:hypothetical protein
VRKDGEAESKREKESTTAAHRLPRAEENNGGGELFTAERKMGWRGGGATPYSEGAGWGSRRETTVGAGEPGG